MNWPRPGGLSSLRRKRCRCEIGERHIAAAILLVSIFCCLTVPAHAQYREHALPTASRAGDLQIGGGLILGASDYNFNSVHLIGGAAYTTFDARAHWGGEFNFHQSQPTSDSTVYERTYEVGPRIYLDHERIAPYAKILYGRGIYNFHNTVANLAYNMYTFGGGADFAITRSLNLRADYEYQNWVGFPLGTLHPSVGTIGIAFHFHE